MAGRGSAPRARGVGAKGSGGRRRGLAGSAPRARGVGAKGLGCRLVCLGTPRIGTEDGIGRRRLLRSESMGPCQVRRLPERGKRGRPISVAGTYAAVARAAPGLHRGAGLREGAVTTAHAAGALGGRTPGRYGSFPPRRCGGLFRSRAAAFRLGAAREGGEGSALRGGRSVEDRLALLLVASGEAHGAHGLLAFRAGQASIEGLEHAPLLSLPGLRGRHALRVRGHDGLAWLVGGARRSGRIGSTSRRGAFAGWVLLDRRRRSGVLTPARLLGCFDSTASQDTAGQEAAGQQEDGSVGSLHLLSSSPAMPATYRQRCLPTTADARRSA
ncbi:uncharacterized protein CMC5_068230 [Chondromyces crocatus]|uniref:Uncharacterized protein n=1 Tax=Chondromyces crocatus TaxID=52 RepID=A0A0K1EP24_CHOCO|nr:uncharacterized protein CMC5_068230 [Chondromyces crocatus]